MNTQIIKRYFAAIIKNNLLILLAIFSGLTVQTLAQATRVANFSYGKGKSYEYFSFRVENGRRAEINYAYQKSVKSKTTTPVAIKYGGRLDEQGAAAFKLVFPNNLVLLVFPQKSYLKVANERGTGAKIFRSRI